jgi:hypothetical protein
MRWNRSGRLHVNMENNSVPAEDAEAKGQWSGQLKSIENDHVRPEDMQTKIK